jgi:osmoprotectant transport system substrate-binding protein
MRRISLGVGAAGAALTLLLTGCGDAGSSGTSTSGGSSTTATSGGGSADCKPVAGDQIVVLTDDKKLQTVDNIIPAIHAAAATQPLLDALNKVSDALTTEELIVLNKKVVVDRATSPNVAKEFVQAEHLTEGLSGGSGKIVIGAANFAENQTLAEIYKLVLDAAGFSASTKTLGNREVYEPALEKGEIQVVPEYAGTLTEFLNKKVNGTDAAPLASGDLDATVQALTQLGDKVGLKFGKPSPAADQNAFAVTKAFADQHGVATLSDLASECGPDTIVLGGPPECPQRPFCQPGLEKTYGLKFANFTALDAGGPLTQTALKQGKITLGLVFSSDGALAGS